MLEIESLLGYPKRVFLAADKIDARKDKIGT